MAPCGLTGRDALMLFVPVGWTIAGTAAAIYYFACPEDICPRTLPGCAALSSAVASFMFSVNLACYHTRRAFARRMLPERRRCFLVFKTIFSLFSAYNVACHLATLIICSYAGRICCYDSLLLESGRPGHI
mgnify:CR=1 FL=1